MGRASGILMHVTSLPGIEGIGTFGKSAYQFIDFLKEAGQKYWQILPLVPAGYGNSPYQSFSAFAGNPYLIDLQRLKEEGLLDIREDIMLDKNQLVGKVNFEVIGSRKLKILSKAYQRSKDNKYIKEEIVRFTNANKEWLEDYCLFMAIKESQQEVAWYEWPYRFKNREAAALAQIKIQLRETIEFWKFIQYQFNKQWMKLKAYANQQGIKIIGDIPIYVSADSSDTWAHPEFFRLDKNYRPIVVAGCPPDTFTAEGQLWGNPIYNWQALEKKHFKWWVDRLRQNTKLYDMIRIDHFRGFESYWEVLATEETAKNGRWIKGPGYKLFEAIYRELGEVAIIAEDLGFITDEVIALREKVGCPGMSILQFAFDPKGGSQYLPHNCEKNTVAYIGTHDNETIQGWLVNPDHKEELKFAKHYLRLTSKEGYYWGFIRGLWSSPAKLVIIQMQDLLGLDNEARMNIPSTLGDNWTWRMQEDGVTKQVIRKLRQITRLYGRE